MCCSHDILCQNIGFTIVHTFRGSHLHTIIQKKFSIANIYLLTLIVLASITKKGEIVSAINPKWGFWWFNDKTNKGTNSFCSQCLIRRKQELKEAPRTSCNGRIKIYVKSCVAWCNSSLFFSAQVQVFAIAQVPKFKSYFWKPKITLTLFGWAWLGLRNLECSCWKAAELLQLQLSFPAELNFSCDELLQL